MIKYIIGIDPSFSTMAVAVYDIEKKDLIHYSGTLDCCFAWLDGQYNKENLAAITEDPSLDKATFGAMSMAISALQRYAKKQISFAESKTAIGTAIGIASRVGESKAAGKYVIENLKSRAIPFVGVAPSDREKAYRVMNGKKFRLNVLTLKMPTKTDQKQYKQLTGFSGRTNEHERDAGTLAYGQNPLRLMFLNQINKNQKN